ncbi:hypothetical protein H9L39_16227 [Fusarium oxysporum f. sp. albedinis]|jgi:hypothetical protein|nr:hypothetical protein H9L39_16227 [Fusarium oxysporum f. sp. albedinis]
MFSVSEVMSPSVPGEEMDTDPWNEDDLDNDPTLPDPDTLLLRPRGPDNQVGSLLGVIALPVHRHDA